MEYLQIITEYVWMCLCGLKMCGIFCLLYRILQQHNND